jgi:glycosyltransferase involved in cell wall biosynthesis
VSQKLEVYRFFDQPPKIMLVRRGAPFSIDPVIHVEPQRIGLPVIGLDGGIGRRLMGFVAVAGYLSLALLLALKLNRRKLVIELVHAHFIFPQGLFGLALARLCRVPLIISAVGSDVNVFVRQNPLLAVLCRLVLKRAAVTIAVSRPLQAALRRFGISSIYLPNSVDTISILPKTESANQTILFVGSMTENKRPLVVLDAFERVFKRIPSATLIMCGDGPLRKTVEDRIVQKRLEGRITVKPRLPHESILELLSHTRVFVNSSLHEGISNALLEAMAAGKAIVASANESHSEMFRDGDNALLFRPDDHKDLAEKLIRVMSNRRLSARLSTSVRELCVKQFSRPKAAAELEKIYVACTAHRRFCEH